MTQKSHLLRQTVELMQREWISFPATLASLVSTYYLERKAVEFFVTAELVGTGRVVTVNAKGKERMLAIFTLGAILARKGTLERVTLKIEGTCVVK